MTALVVDEMKTDRPPVDEFWSQLHHDASNVERYEPELSSLLRQTVLSPGVESFEDAVATTIAFRLQLLSNNPASISTITTTMGMKVDELRNLIREAMNSDVREMHHTISEAIREDALAVCRRDPATETVLEVVLFSKGYAALVAHRVAFRLYPTRKFTALYLQSQASAAFGLDIHPCAQIGIDIMFDHGTGIVVGETATIGDGCTFLHGVTLGGTGKEHGDRHPKVGRNVFIGAGASILGNITIGCGAKIGAGSVVLRPIPKMATAVGAPARIIGRSTEPTAGSDVDASLQHLRPLHDSSAMLKQPLQQRRPSLSETDATTSSDSVSSEENELKCPLCPWKQYVEMAARAPAGAVTICTVFKLLQPHGCTMEQIGNCFFELDTDAVGYVLLQEFRDKAPEVIVVNTCLSAGEVEAIVEEFFQKVDDNQLHRDCVLGPNCVSVTTD